MTAVEATNQITPPEQKPVVDTHQIRQEQIWTNEMKSKFEDMIAVLQTMDKRFVQ